MSSSKPTEDVMSSSKPTEDVMSSSKPTEDVMLQMFSFIVKKLHEAF